MRVLVTRPEPAAGRTAARLAAAGHAVLRVPLLVRRGTGTAAPPGPVAAVLLTSAAALASPGPDLSAWFAVPLFAVGAESAAAARRAGFVSVEEGGGDAGALAARVAATLRPGAALLHLAGRDRKPEPAASLAARGFTVRAWEIYAMEAADRCPAPLREALVRGTLDAALHYSRRSAETLLALAGRDGLGEPLARLRHLCLSADVAAVFPGAAAIAARPDEESLLAALDAMTAP